MNKLYVLIGVPAAGKSTWVANQDWAKDCAYISTDKFVDAEAKRVGQTYNAVFKDYMSVAVNLMCEAVISARAAKQDIIWDQTSCTVSSRKKKFKMLPDYHAIAVVFKTPEKGELERRLASRPGKNIPDCVMESMISSWQEPTEEEGFMEIWQAS
jgi:predicted kinase